MVKNISSWNKPAFLTAWQSPEGERDPEITVWPATHCLSLSYTHLCAHPHAHVHARTHAQARAHTHRHTPVHRGAEQEKRLCLAGQLYGQAEISGCFPSSKLLVSVVTDRQSDSQILSLSLSLSHTTHNDGHRDGQTWLIDEDTFCNAGEDKKCPQSEKLISSTEN